jgi:hypothetical protein
MIVFALLEVDAGIQISISTSPVRLRDKDAGASLKRLMGDLIFRFL